MHLINTRTEQPPTPCLLYFKHADMDTHTHTPQERLSAVELVGTAGWPQPGSTSIPAEESALGGPPTPPQVGVDQKATIGLLRRLRSWLRVPARPASAQTASVHGEHSQGCTFRPASPFPLPNSRCSFLSKGVGREEAQLLPLVLQPTPCGHSHRGGWLASRLARETRQAVTERSAVIRFPFQSVLPELLSLLDWPPRKICLPRGSGGTHWLPSEWATRPGPTSKGGAFLFLWEQVTVPNGLLTHLKLSESNGNKHSWPRPPKAPIPPNPSVPHLTSPGHCGSPPSRLFSSSFAAFSFCCKWANLDGRAFVCLSVCLFCSHF